MAHISSDAADFAASALRGFCLAHSDIVSPVRAGAIRATPGPQGKVAVVVGGGSGHCPAFLGFVGHGFADAAVAGDVFASPSTQAIIGVARAANLGAGVILGYGNYAGDVLNFGIAAQRLRDEGIDARVVATTDDVASAGDDERTRRRGIAGDLSIFKIIGAAAEAGLPIDEVERIGLAANDLTRTFGVAFGGCTIPGEREKLFEVPAGLMALGLGVHGEPGIGEQAIPPAPELATLLFDRVVAEAPAQGGKRIAVLLNGLGSTKYEELYVLWSHLADRFREAGFDLVAPLVGEYVTSLEMAGCSLTVTWLDRELEQLWRAAVHSPGLSRPVIDGDAPLQAVVPHAPHADVPAAVTIRGRDGGACVARALQTLAEALAEAEGELGRIDAQAGDGDHGQGMARGSAAAAKAAEEARTAGGGARGVLAVAADAWADRAGGTSGALWGEGLRAFSAALDDAGRPDASQLAGGARAAMDRIVALGKAQPGDKTLIDALHPFVTTLEAELAAGQELAAAWTKASEAAHAAAEATRTLMPRLGRARTHGDRSKGHPDAGALSMALATSVVGKTIAVPVKETT